MLRLRKPLTEFVSTGQRGQPSPLALKT
jgi:hypothetical protein